MLDRIGAYAKKKKVSRSQIIRDAIEYHLHKLNENKPKENDFSWIRNAAKYSVNMGGDVASHIDDILYS